MIVLRWLLLDNTDLLLPRWHGINQAYRRQWCCPRGLPAVRHLEFSACALIFRLLDVKPWQILDCVKKSGSCYLTLGQNGVVTLLEVRKPILIDHGAGLAQCCCAPEVLATACGSSFVKQIVDPTNHIFDLLSKI